MKKMTLTMVAALLSVITICATGCNTTAKDTDLTSEKTISEKTTTMETTELQTSEPIVTKNTTIKEDVSYLNTMDEYFASDCVLDVLKVKYYGDVADYVKHSDDTEERALEIHDDMVSYYAEVIAAYCGIDTDNLFEETLSAYRKFAEKILKQADFKVEDSEKNGDYCDVIVYTKPIKLLEQMDKPLETCIDSFMAQFDNMFDNMTDEEYYALTDDDFDAMENNYAQTVLEELETCSKNLEYGETISFIVQIQMETDMTVKFNTITYRYSLVDESAMDTLDDLILGLSDYKQDTEDIEDIEDTENIEDIIEDFME